MYPHSALAGLEFGIRQVCHRVFRQVPHAPHHAGRTTPPARGARCPPGHQSSTDSTRVQTKLPARLANGAGPGAQRETSAGCCTVIHFLLFHGSSSGTSHVCLTRQRGPPFLKIVSSVLTV